MRAEFLYWHYNHAMRRQKLEVEAKDEDRRFWLALMNPEAYEKLVKSEEPANQTENLAYESEDANELDSEGRIIGVNQDDFSRFAQMARQTKTERVLQEVEVETPDEERKMFEQMNQISVSREWE